MRPGDAVVGHRQQRDGRAADPAERGRVHRGTHEVECVDDRQGRVQVGTHAGQPELDRVVPRRVQQGERGDRPVHGVVVQFARERTTRWSSSRSASRSPSPTSSHADADTGPGAVGRGSGSQGVCRGNGGSGGDGR